jgi:hypothetical protein
MATITVVESAAANVAAGSDLMANNFFQFDARPRIVSRIAVTGSAVLGDAYISLFYGTEKIGDYYPSTIGVVFGLEARDYLPVRTNRALRPNEPIRLIVGKVSVTNGFKVVLEVQEVG